MGAKLGGGGGSKYTVQQNSDINVTPFVDVMLVLLIIFMVSIPPATVSIKLDLPPAHSPPSAVKQKDPVFVTIQGPDDIYIGSRKTTVATLPGDLIAALNDPHPYDQRVLIRGDKDIQYDDFVKVLNTLQQHGFLKVALITEDID